MQEQIFTQPKGFTFESMPVTDDEADKMLQSQVALTGIFMMHMGQHLAEAQRQYRHQMEDA